MITAACACRKRVLVLHTDGLDHLCRARTRQDCIDLGHQHTRPCPRCRVALTRSIFSCRHGSEIVTRCEQDHRLAVA